MSLFNAFDEDAQHQDSNSLYSGDKYDYFTIDNFIKRSAAPSPGSYFKHPEFHRSVVDTESSDKSPFGASSFKSLVDPLSEFVRNHYTKPVDSSRTITSNQSSLFDLDKIQSSSVVTDHEHMNEMLKNKDYYLLEDSSDLYLSTLSSIESKRLANARTQLLVWAYFKSFKLISFVTALIFLCIILSLLTQLSCLPELTSLFPRFEIQVSGSLPYVDGYTVGNMFTMKGIADNNHNKSEIIISANKLITVLANDFFGVHFGYDTINNTLKNIFENNRKVVFKIGYLGYCKFIEMQTVNQVTCHSVWQSSTDMPSIFIKDITYEMNVQMLNYNAEQASDVFINNYHRLIRNASDTITKNTEELYSTGVLSLFLSEVVTWLRITYIGLDTLSLALCFLIFLSFKGKASKKSLAKIKDKVNKSLNPFQIPILNKRKYVDILLITANTLLTISLFLQMIVLIYGITYLKKIDEVLRVKNFQFINGIKLLGFGTMVDLSNCLFHFVLIGLITSLVLRKPWIMKIVI